MNVVVRPGLRKQNQQFMNEPLPTSILRNDESENHEGGSDIDPFT
jgi:hypothetical protein